MIRSRHANYGRASDFSGAKYTTAAVQSSPQTGQQYQFKRGNECDGSALISSAATALLNYIPCEHRADSFRSEFSLRKSAASSSDTVDLSAVHISAKQRPRLGPFGGGGGGGGGGGQKAAQNNINFG